MTPVSIPEQAFGVPPYRVRPQVQPYPATETQSARAQAPRRAVSAEGADKREPASGQSLKQEPEGSAPATKSPVLGVVGMMLVLMAAGVYFVGCYYLFQALGPSFDPTHPSLTLDDLAPYAYPLLTVAAAVLVGIVGWALSIAAAAADAGRAVGIIGIVVGVLAPFSALGAAQMALGVFTS